MSGILIRSMLNLQMFGGITNLTRLILPWIWYIFQYIEVFSLFHHLIIFNVQIFHLPGYIYSSVFIPFNAIKNWIILISDAHFCTLKCNRVLYIYFESLKLLNLLICSNLCNLDIFIYISCLITLARSLSTIFSRIGKNEHFALLLM